MGMANQVGAQSWRKLIASNSLTVLCNTCTSDYKAKLKVMLLVCLAGS